MLLVPAFIGAYRITSFETTIHLFVELRGNYVATRVATMMAPGDVVEKCIQS
jgi:hypothetical protein